METNWAAEHLQTIRTLMERSALYRRALAPISMFVGTVGITATVLGWVLQIQTTAGFASFWMLVGLVAISGALLLVRKQAVKHGEPFWSPPMRRVVQAMVPALLIGLVFGLLQMPYSKTKLRLSDPLIPMILIAIWTLLYGLALHAAGFFMPRGIRLFSWIFILTGIVILFMNTFGLLDNFIDDPNISPHFLMGILFGASHLAYGIYLYFTERKNEA